MERDGPLGVLLDHTQDKIAVVDETGTFTYLNDAVSRILGFDPEDLVGENAFDYIHPDDGDDVRRAFGRVIRRESFAETTVEYRHRAADGSWVWLESRMSNLTDSVLGGFVVSSRDVTDRVRAEMNQQETASRLRELAATTGDVLWMFDGDWSEVLFVNPAFEDTYGLSIEELEADPSAFLEAVYPDDVPVVADAMERLTEGQSAEIEYRVNPADDYDKWVWVQGEPITEGDEVVRIVGFSRDITDRRRRERQLIVMDNLLRHNLRNDLNLILGTAALIEDEVPETADRTAVIRRTGEALLQSAEKEREVIDLVTGRADRESLDLREAVDAGVEAIRERYPDVTVDVSGPDAVVVRGRSELRSAVIELLENAIQHSDDDRPTVRVTIQETATHAEVVVEDESSPIPAVEADVLRGNHDMSEVYHSSGLGMWLVYWCVELSDGDIVVTSEEGVGNRITLSVPRDDQ